MMGEKKAPCHGVGQIAACCDSEHNHGCDDRHSSDGCHAGGSPADEGPSKQEQTKATRHSAEAEFTSCQTTKEGTPCCNTTSLNEVTTSDCCPGHDGHAVTSDVHQQGRHHRSADAALPQDNCKSSDCCGDSEESIDSHSKTISQLSHHHHSSSGHQGFPPSLSKLGGCCGEVTADDIPRCCSSGGTPSRPVSTMGQITSKLGDKKHFSVVTSSCCGSSDSLDHNHGLCSNTDENPHGPIEVDLEGGPAVFEHVLLTVQGMTCSGCEKNLLNALSTIRTIRNIKTSLILARAEFDIDLNHISVDDAVASVRRKTGYVCSRIFEDKSAQALDLSIPASSQKLFCDLNFNELSGVIDMIPLGPQTIRVQYDAHTIGARALLELLETSWNEKIQPKENRGPKEILQIAPIPPPPAIAAGKRQVRKQGTLFFISAILTIPVLVFSYSSFPAKQKHEVAFDAASLALATIIQAGVAVEIYPSALKSLFHSSLIEMDLLIMLSTTTAYIFSVVAFAYLATGNPLPSGQFFETSTLLVTLIMLGRFINELARQKATETVSIRSLQPAKALLLSKDRRTTTEIDVRLLQYGDIFRVPPDSRIVTDGIVVHGGSEVDESMVTGESMPVAKAIGSKVIAGSVNGSGMIDVLLEKLPWENTISTIATMVDEAELSKPKVQKLADKIAGYFVPVIVTITVIVFIIWILVGRFVKHESASVTAINALTFAIATLIVSCPCAVGLAVPMVVVIANGVAAKQGIVLKAPEIIENAKRITHAIFDKTGTLTENKLSVIKERYHDFPALTEDHIKALLLSLVDGVTHPVAKAVALHLKEDIGPSPRLIEHVKVLTGKGIEGAYDGMKLRAGNTRWLGLGSMDSMQRISGESRSTFCFMIDDFLAATFTLTSSLRPEAASVVTKLVKRGVKVSILSGDDAAAVHAVAMELGVPIGNTKSRCTPADKAKYVQDILNDNPKAVTLFCGDGTNDAAALKMASIGVHMCDGTDIAQGAADVILVRPNLNCILDLLDISKAAYRRIIFNFVWSGIYNISAILLAAGALAELHVRIPPEFAGLGELVSVLPVILIAVQLRFVSFGNK